MSISSLRSWAIYTALALAPSAAFAGHVRDAAIGPVEGVIYTCVNREDGQIRVINPDGRRRCHANETMVSWTQSGPEAEAVQGPMGPAGPAGPMGPMGPPGPAGAQGSQGLPGPMGMEGPVGPVGPEGAPGVAGPQGPKGDKGDTGAAGPKGDKGDTGAQGPKGDTGPQGLKGDKGDTGAAGPKGDTGAQGPQGETGAQGPKGDKGDKGDTGAQGPAGPPGPSSIPTVVSIVGDKPWNSQTDNTFRAVPFLTVNVSMLNAAPVAVTWSLAVPMNGAIVTRLCIDGVVVPGTNVVVGNTTYATSTGSYFVTLPAGSHTITLEYRTNMAFTFDPTANWQSSRLQVIAWDQ